MKSTFSHESRFTAYEYNTVRVNAESEMLYRDSYQDFGWDIDDRESSAPSQSVTLTFKRDRGIRNRAAVTELQRTCEDALHSIRKLERSVSATAIAVAAAFGVIGAALLAGSVFALEADLTVVSIALGANGVFAWIGGFLAHGRVRTRRAASVSPAIENQYELVMDARRHAAQLLDPTTAAPETTL